MTAGGIGLGVLVFVLAMTTDCVVTLYYRACALGQIFRAVTTSMMICLLGTIATLAITQHSCWYILPELAGVGLGTGIGVWIGRPRD